MAAHHYSWPYPRTHEQVIQVVMVALAVIFVGLIGAAAQAEHYQNKPLNSDAVQQAATSLAGYASEGAAVTGQAAAGRSTQHYQRAYLDELADETQQVTEFLSAHTASGSLVQPRRELIEYGNKLQQRLESAAEYSQPSKFKQAQGELTRLQGQLQMLEKAE